VRAAMSAMNDPQTSDTVVRSGSGAKQYQSKFVGNALLVGGAIAVMVAMAGWLYPGLAWLAVTWILS
jgi:hypothetical protein